MKASELMIGDWVNEGTHNVKVYEFDRYEIRYEYVDSAYADIRTTSRFLAECKPIPLTEEILKANLKLIDDWDCLYKISGRLCYDFEHSTLCYLLNDLAWPICEINYVHELQHTLRLCGLNDLADNFKV